ncbi:MAG TPA: hypothetical protein VEA15_03405 [Caulobacteraceae bacterium]|nr:hypothetical protein [Caulobacteraceae bacterium]
MVRKFALVAKLAVVAALLAASSAASQPSERVLQSKMPKDTAARCTFQECRVICATTLEWGSSEWADCVYACVGVDNC